jgi:hypothetical protein
MGYIGLLLNDPYKIDRMGCVCGYISVSTSCSYFLIYILGYINPLCSLQKRTLMCVTNGFSGFKKVLDSLNRKPWF